MNQINPYNFVPLEQDKCNRNDDHPFLHRFSEDHFTGTLVCELTALTDIITLDQRDPYYETVHDAEKKPLLGKNGKGIKIYFHRFLRNSQGQPIIQGTSIKGMVRAVYEAMSASCMRFAADQGVSVKSKTNRIDYKYGTIGEYENLLCNNKTALCPACRLFGVLAGDLSCRGRVTFTDAVLVRGSLNKGKRIYKYLSNPKPHHHQTYGKSGKGGEIAGRKFYYHQKNGAGWAHDPANFDPYKIQWCRGVTEVASKGVVFKFCVAVDNVSAVEIEALIAAIELYQGLGHKIGLGKAIGLGSCAIAVNTQDSRVFDPSSRYASIGAQPVQNLTDFKTASKRVPEDFPPMLWEVLRLDKADESGEIGYPQVYPRTETIDVLGVFGGKTKTLEGLISAEEEADEGPQDPPPKVSQDQIAAWLKETYQDRLVFFDESGNEIIRPRNAYQGKKAQLLTGNWFILFGGKASKPN